MHSRTERHMSETVAIDPVLAREIIERMGATGQPPEIGIEYVNVGNETYLAIMVEEYLLPIKQSGRGSSFKLVQAYFGGGKTHFLLLVRGQAWSLGYPAAIVGLSPGECPFDDVVKVYASVAREICWPPSDPHVLPQRGIDVLLRSVVDERVERVGRETVRTWVDGQLRRAPVDSYSYRAAVVSFILAYLDDRFEEEETLAAFLRGEDVHASELRPHRIREGLAKHTAKRFLRSLVQVLHHLGAPGLLLCFDEMDRSMSFTQRRRRAIADNLRELIDDCGKGVMPGLVCMYAVPPEFMRNVVTEYTALQQRLDTPTCLSARSPQSVLIDLEELDLPHGEVLHRIGTRILEVFCCATGTRLDPGVQSTNIEVLARTVLENTWDVAQRRTFVKAVVALFFEQKADGERSIDPGEAAAFVHRAAEEGIDFEDDDDDGDFENN